MKLYDFACADCAKTFEDLVAAGESPRCPACGSARVARQLSAFSVGGAARTNIGDSAVAGDCASGACCFGGACDASDVS